MCVSECVCVCVCVVDVIRSTTTSVCVVVVCDAVSYLCDGVPYMPTLPSLTLNCISLAVLSANPPQSVLWR